MKRIYLEITNSCNLNCPFCTSSKGNSFMSYEDIENYVLQIKNVCNYIYLHVLGEPLLHKDLESILNLLDKNNMHLQLVTNGTLLKQHLNIFNHKCLRKLSISLHSINNIDIDESYFKTIEYIIDNFKTNIELRFYDYDNLDNKLKNFLNYLSNKYNVSKTSKTDSYRLNEHTYIYFQNLFNWPEINDEYINDCGMCHGYVDQIAILHDGRVTSCCLDPNGYNCFGNLKENSLENILNSDDYLKHIDSLKKKRILSSLCQRCEYRQRFSRNSN